jgi:asparagine synthase (glutamine-hydrolysing)
MFAFAIYDAVRKNLFLFRDRVGVKPLYYYSTKNLFLYASELKALYKNPNFEKHLDFNSLSLYLKYKYIPSPHTIFKNTYKLRPGHYLRIDLMNHKIKESRYWDVINFYNMPKLSISQEDALEESQRLLESAFQYRMVSDVPVGIFLSGGYDSTAVAALLTKNNTEKIRTFSIGFFENQYDEAPFAKKVAEYLKSEHTEYYCSINDALDIIPKFSDIFDEPFGDASAIPTILLSQMARKKVTVALSADGGDELFGGYNKYLNDRINTCINIMARLNYRLRLKIYGILRAIQSESNFLIHFGDLLRDRSIQAKFNILLHLLKENIPANLYRYKGEPCYFSLLESKKFLLNANFDEIQTCYDNFNKLNKENDYLNKLFAIDFQTFLVDDVLVKVDRASMAVSLEGREPFLDHRLIEYVARLPSYVKCDGKDTKILLKKIVHKYVPRKLMVRPKRGFEVPMRSWLQKELKDMACDCLSYDRIKRQAIFDAKIIGQMTDDYFKGKAIRDYNIWIMLMFQLWYDRWMK